MSPCHQPSLIVIWVQVATEESNSRCSQTFSKFGNELNLYGAKPPYRLHVTTGDPDQATQYSLNAGITKRSVVNGAVAGRTRSAAGEPEHESG